MANIKSAKKRIKVTARRKEENKFKKSELSTAIKKFRAMVAKKELKEAEGFLSEVYRLIDTNGSHGRLHKNNASRKKARLAAMLDKAKQTEGTVEAKVEVKVAKKVEPVVEVAKVEEKPVKKVATTAKKTTTTAKKEATEVKKAPAKKATTTAKKTTTKKEA